MRLKYPAALFWMVVLLPTATFPEISMAPGVMAGFNITGISGKEQLGSDINFGWSNYWLTNRYSYSLGTLLELGLHRNFSLTPALVLENRGFALIPLESTTDEPVITEKLVYLQLSILPKGRINLGRTRPYFGIAPDLGFLLSAKTDAKDGWSIDSTADVRSGFKSMDFGWTYCLGIDVVLGGTISFLQLDYYTGTTNILKHPVREEEAGNFSASLRGGLKMRIH